MKMDSEKKNLKKRLIYLFSVLVILLIVLSSLLIVNHITSGTLIDDTIEEENYGYWNLIPEDEMVWYGNITYQNYINSTFGREYIDLIAEHDFLLRNIIAEVNDLSYDSDEFQDLCVFSDLLWGTEYLNYELPIPVDLDSINSVFGNLMSLLSGVNNYSEFTHSSSFHKISSKLYDNLNTKLLYANSNNFTLPMFTYEQYEDEMPDRDATYTYFYSNTTSENTIEYSKLFGERDFSTGIKFDIQNNNTIDDYQRLSVYHNITTPSVIWADGINDSEIVSFYIYTHPNISLECSLNRRPQAVNYERVIWGNHQVLFANNSVYGFEKAHIGEFSVTNPEAGNWTKFGDLPESQWNFIEFKIFNDENKTLNDSIRINGGEWFEIEDSVPQSYNYPPLAQLSFNVINATINTSVYIDDLDSTFPYTAFTDDPDIVPYTDESNPYFILGYLSYNSLFMFPRNFNYTYLGETMDALIRTNFGDDLSSIYREEDNLFMLIFPDFIIQNILSNFGLSFYEGQIQMMLYIVWDTDIDLMTNLRIVIDYRDLQIERDVEIKLIKTKSSRNSINGYYYFDGTYLDPIYTRYFEEKTIISQLNDDNYSNSIDPEYFTLNFWLYIQNYFDDAGYDIILSKLWQDYGTEIILGIALIYIIINSITIPSIYYFKKNRK